jgi:NADH dehydrogenase
VSTVKTLRKFAAALASIHISQDCHLNFRWIRLTGWIAWMFWGLVHIYFLIGIRTRMMVFLNWPWAYFTYGLGARLITGRQTRQRPDLRSDGSEPRAGG